MKFEYQMLPKLLLATTLVLFAAQSSLAASSQFSGQDDATFPTPTPNASGAFANFKATLASWGTDDAEATAGLDPALSFGATGITGTASGVLAQVAPGFTSSGNGALLETDAAMAVAGPISTVFSFSAPVTAFGLFLIQGGDGVSNNPVTFTFENTLSLSSKPVVVQVGPGWAVQNSFFFGYTDTDSFNKVTLTETIDLQDGMLYDDITVGALVPEPSSMVLLGTAVVLVPLALRRRRFARLASR